MRKSLTATVSIFPVGSRDTSGGTVRVRVPLTDPDNGEARDAGELETAAIALGCKKLYGRTTFWWADSGLAGYGQVMRPCKTGGSDAVTYRARLDVEVPDLPASHLEELAARDARWADYQEECQRDYAAGFDAYPTRPSGYWSYDYKRGWETARDCARQDAEYARASNA